MKQWPKNGSLNRTRQRGAITMFSAVLILILLTEMVLYAVQVGVFEQRKASNEVRQKTAFHIADSAIQQAKEFIKENSIFISSSESELAPIVVSGEIVGYKPGWLAAGSSRWQACGTACEDDATQRHPCCAAVPRFRSDSYFYELDGSNLLIDDVVVGDPATQQADVHALLCMLDIDRDKDPIVQGCAGAGSEAKHDDRYYVVTLLARGEADCRTEGGVTSCDAEALVSEKVASFAPGGGEGGPAAPLTTRSTLPESGDTDIVPNPNGGGIGVPISVWLDAKKADIEGFGGSWATCERHEWYEVDILPDDGRCPAASGICTCDGKKQLSYSEPGADQQHLDIDMVPDDSFPPDLFKYIFLYEGNEEGVDYVKSIADEVLDDCSSLGQGSYGLILVEGDCDLSGNAVIGSITAPVFLVMAGSENSVGGNVEFFGTILFTDAAGNGSSLKGNGNITIYGAMIADGDISQFGGNLKLVYLESVINQSLDKGGFGAIAGGWSDFHPDWR